MGGRAAQGAAVTAELVRAAVARAARAAFDLGVRQGKKGGTGKPNAVQAELAARYAEQLVMPVVEATVEQAVEDGFAAARATDRA